MSKKCKAYSASKLGLEAPDTRKAFYAGWDAAIEAALTPGEPVAFPEGYEIHELPADYTGPAWIEGQVRSLYARTAPQPQPKQEPVACPSVAMDGKVRPVLSFEKYEGDYASGIYAERIPLFTAPQPQREWVSLTDEEIAFCRFEARVESGPFKRDGTTTTRLARAIEAKLREKNGGGV